MKNTQKILKQGTSQTRSLSLAGLNTELSVAEISTSDKDRRITTAGYIFDAATNTTSVAQNVSSRNAYPATANSTAVTYGVEWRGNGNVVVYVDGTRVHTLQGSDWNPAQVSEEMKLVVDLSLNVPKYGDPELAASESVEAVVDYIAVWKRVRPTASIPPVLDAAVLPICTCKKTWSHGARTYSGCSTTLDSLGQSWCYTAGGACKGSLPSNAFGGWHMSACDQAVSAVLAEPNPCSGLRRKKCFLKQDNGVCRWVGGKGKGCYEAGQDLPCKSLATKWKCRKAGSDHPIFSSNIGMNKRCMWFKNKCIDSLVCDPGEENLADGESATTRTGSPCCEKKKNNCWVHRDVCSWVKSSVCIPRPEVDGTRLRLLQSAPQGPQSLGQTILGSNVMPILVQAAGEEQKAATAAAAGVGTPIQRAALRPNDAEVAQMFAEIDVNNDGVSHAEMVAVLGAMVGTVISEAELNAAATEAIAEFDANGDGKVTTNEVKQLWEQKAVYVHGYDVDKDGTVTVDEIKQVVKELFLADAVNEIFAEVHPPTAEAPRGTALEGAKAGKMSKAGSK